MSSRITESAVKEALALLEDLRNPKWGDIYWEFQDGGTNVLFRVDVSDASAKEIDSFCSERITSAFDMLFPAPSGKIVWVTVFRDHDLLVTAYNGNGVASSAA